MMDRDTDQERAMAIAQPILCDLYAVLDESVAFYFSENYTDRARAEHTDRAAANCVYSHAENRMVDLADRTPGLNVINVNSMRVANYLDKGLFRFKLVKASGRHRNYQTKQQEDYDDQLPIAGLPDPAIRMTVGYELNAAGAGLKRIMIARPIGRTIFWTAQVLMDAGAARWEDTTPRRFGATEGSDFDAERARKRRGHG
jgi:hypothetical protein